MAVNTPVSAHIENDPLAGALCLEHGSLEIDVRVALGIKLVNGKIRGGRRARR